MSSGGGRSSTRLESFMKRSKQRPEERDPAFLRDIVIEAKDVGDFTRGMNLLTFTADRLVRKAVTKCLESIAGASKNLSPALKERHPAIAWRQIAAFRDFSAHHDWEIDYSLVWDIVREHLPPLLLVVEQELSSRDR
jgi:uncharacterized protein with HEPN domain